MKILLWFSLFLSILQLHACNRCARQDFTIYYFNKGEIQELDISEKVDLITTVEKLIIEADYMLRLAVDDERIKEIKKSESGIEIVLSKRMLILSKVHGLQKISQVLLPFEGDYVGDTDSPIVTIFIGDDSYETGPLRNSDGLEDLNKIKRIISPYLDKNPFINE